MQIRKLLISGALAVSALAAGPASAATNFFDDWEDTDFGSSAGYTIVQSYSGWNNTTSATGSGIEIQYNNVAGSPYSGENFVELDSNLNSIMSYGTGLDAGSYVLSFFYSDRPNVGAGSNGIDVLLNGITIFSVAGGNGGANTNWLYQTFGFTAAAGDVLSFAATGTSDSYGGYIDDVRLESAVPEPGTWAMMLLGFGFIGTAMRRRSRAMVRRQTA